MISSASQSRKVVGPEFSPEVRLGLDQLVRALDYARDLNCPYWDFAVEMDRLLVLGMTTSDLRWLVKRGYLSHAQEITAAQDAERRFEPPVQNLAFAKTTCFVLTEAGQAMLGLPVLAVPLVRDHSPANYLVADPQIDLPSRALAGEQPQRGAIPNWDRDSRTFLVGDYLIKRFRVPSPNQEAVLEAFQEEGWPTSIDDPLSPVPDQLPKRRLRDTIKCLNSNQAVQLIRFRGDGTGQRVVWELVAETASHADATEIQPLRRAA